MHESPRLATRARKGLLALVALAVASPLGAGGASASTRPADVPPVLASPVAAVEQIVTSLQLTLQAAGYRPGAVQGHFDAATQQALIRYQANAHLPANERGTLGPLTARALVAGASPVVQALQSALTDVGLFRVTINGLYGPKTTAALQALQRQAHLPATGLYGPRSATALTQLYTKTVPEPSPPAGKSAPSAGATLTLGSKGPQVVALQKRLTALGYRPGPPDGLYGASVASAVLAFQKREGLTRSGNAGTATQAALVKPKGAGPHATGPVPRVEVDIARQIAFVVLPSRGVITLNVSTGSGNTYRVPGGGTDVASTPVGSFTVLRKIVGDEIAPLGTLHSPMYFYRGWAIHGAANVPAYPASHGCVRVSNTDADWLFPLIARGTAVVLYDTTGKSPRPGGTPSRAPPGH